MGQDRGQHRDVFGQDRPKPDALAGERRGSESGRRDQVVVDSHGAIMARDRRSESWRIGAAVTHRTGTGPRRRRSICQRGQSAAVGLPAGRPASPSTSSGTSKMAPSTIRHARTLAAPVTGSAWSAGQRHERGRARPGRAPARRPWELGRAADRTWLWTMPQVTSSASSIASEDPQQVVGVDLVAERRGGAGCGWGASAWARRLLRPACVPATRPHASFGYSARA